MEVKESHTQDFFFILGRPRSGTTLLRTLFDAHPHVLIPFEAPIIFYLSLKYAARTQWNTNDLESFYQDMCRIRKFDQWPLNREALKRDIFQMTGNHSFTDIVRVIYLHYSSLFPKEEIRLIGDKNPFYSYCVRRIFQVFPEARYIHLIRDYRDNIASIRNFDFNPYSSAVLAYRWKQSLLRIEALKKKYPDRFYSVRYEDFIDKPRYYFRELCSFLDLPYVDSVFDYYKNAEELLSSYPETFREKVNKFQSDLFKPINTSHKGRYKRDLSKRDLMLAEYVCGKEAAAFSYEKDFLYFPLYISLLAQYHVLIYRIWRTLLFIWRRSSRLLFRYYRFAQ
jgi:hypothetical protein